MTSPFSTKPVWRWPVRISRSTSRPAVIESIDSNISVSVVARSTALRLRKTSTPAATTRRGARTPATDGPSTRGRAMNLTRSTSIRSVLEPIEPLVVLGAARSSRLVTMRAAVPVAKIARVRLTMRVNPIGLLMRSVSVTLPVPRFSMSTRLGAAECLRSKRMVAFSRRLDAVLLFGASSTTGSATVVARHHVDAPDGEVAVGGVDHHDAGERVAELEGGQRGRRPVGDVVVGRHPDVAVAAVGDGGDRDATRGVERDRLADDRRHGGPGAVDHLDGASGEHVAGGIDDQQRAAVGAAEDDDVGIPHDPTGPCRRRVVVAGDPVVEPVDRDRSRSLPPRTTPAAASPGEPGCWSGPAWRREHRRPPARRHRRRPGWSASRCPGPGLPAGR